MSVIRRLASDGDRIHQWLPRIFLFLSSVVVLVYAIIVPPMQAPDEPALQAVERDTDDLLALAFGRLSSGAIGSEQFDTFATLNGSVQEAIARRARQLGHERAAAQAEALAQRSSAPGSA